MSPTPSPTQQGSPEPRITKALPNTDPPMGDGAGAEHKALPTLGALTELPLVVPPLVFSQV